MEVKKKTDRPYGELRLRVKFAFLPIIDPVSDRRWAFEGVWVVQRYVGKLFWEVWADVEVKSKLGEFELYRIDYTNFGYPMPILIPKE